MSEREPVAEREVALAGLLRCAEPPVPELLASFVAGVGPAEAWHAITRRRAPEPVQTVVAARIGVLGPDELDARAADDVRVARRAGARLIAPGDASWPDECWAPLAWVRPYEQARCAAAPLALYYRGDRWPTRPRGAAAVVGSRAATPYGVRVATELAAAAVDDGYTVVSGAAFGIDAAAHRGALHAVGPDAVDRVDSSATVAVLACGIDRSYPSAHRALIDQIALHGAVISEYPPGTTPARYRFLVRNRLIAAFAEGTVVVEAGRRSGSLNTATTAGNMGRQVLAVPGSVGSAMSVGCHDLIRDCKATLVTSWPDVAALLGPLRPAPSPHRPGDRATDGLDLITSRVQEALPARGAVTAEALSMEAALPVPDVLGALAVLHTDGLARRREGLWARA